MMNVSVEEKKAEAIARMKTLKIYGPVIEQFRKSGTLNKSMGPLGACYWLDDDEKAKVMEFENQHNALVYHVIHDAYDVDGMRMEFKTYLYVSDEKEEWEEDREDLKDGYIIAYVENVTFPQFSEFGGVSVKLTAAAGLKRVA